MAEERPSGSQPRGGRSHYQFKSWTWDANGKRSDAIPANSRLSGEADLVNSCYVNPLKGTHTLYTLAFDLDAHRADSKWKTKDGKLKWAKIKRLLKEKYPELLGYIFAVVKSTGGKGLAVYLALSPLELVSTTLRAQVAATALQQQIIALFNQHGLGADPSALGLKRDFCNWLNKERTLYSNTLILSSVQSARTPMPDYIHRFC